MIDEYSDIEKIEQFLLGKMGAEEAAIFENRIAEDASLRKELFAFDAILKALRNHDSELFKQKLRDREMLIANRPISFFRKYRFAMAASLLLLLSIGAAIFVFSARTPLHEKLVVLYKPIEPGLPVLMDNSDSRSISDAMSLFQDAKFEESLLLFDGLLAEKPANDTLLFFDALCNFELEKYSEAQKKLEMVLSCENSVWIEKSEWWLALSFLSQNEKAKSRLLLQKIEAEKGHLFNEKAGQLLVEDYFLSN